LGYTLSGQVTRAGQAVPEVMVTAVRRTGGGDLPGIGRTDASGHYQIEGLKEGAYVIAANAGGGSRTQELDISSDATLDLMIPVARLAGTVVDATTKQPIPDAQVTAESQRPQTPGTTIVVAPGPGGGGAGAITDSTGRFALENLEAKDYTLSARKPGFETERRPVAAAENGSDDLVIPLKRGEGIGLLVQDGILRVPLRGVSARAMDAQGASAFMGSVPLDSEGRGEIPALKPGRYTIVIDASGYAPVTLENLQAPVPQVAILMTPGGTVEIRAGQTTLAAGAASFSVLTASGKPYAYSINAPFGRLDLTPQTPVRRLENFSPGSYTLSVKGAGSGKPFTVAEGRVTVVELP